MRNWAQNNKFLVRWASHKFCDYLWAVVGKTEKYQVPEQVAAD